MLAAKRPQPGREQEEKTTTPSQVEIHAATTISTAPPSVTEDELEGGALVAERVLHACLARVIRHDLDSGFGWPLASGPGAGG